MLTSRYDCAPFSTLETRLARRRSDSESHIVGAHRCDLYRLAARLELRHLDCEDGGVRLCSYPGFVGFGIATIVLVPGSIKGALHVRSIVGVFQLLFLVEQASTGGYCVSSFERVWTYCFCCFSASLLSRTLFGVRFLSLRVRCTICSYRALRVGKAMRYPCDRLDVL
jgi:hypothetical protein